MPLRQDRYTHYPRTIFWLVRGGDVRIGGPDADARPAFDTSVDPFYIGKTPITNAQYEAFDSAFERSPISPRDDDPAAGISFEAATAYCEWYASVSKKPIRLPTEIEWEYACRGGSMTRYFFGNDSGAADAFVWDLTNSAGKLAPLSEKRSNPFGLLGMLGGVWEWTGSLHRPYPVVAGDGRNAPGVEGPRVLRGGSVRVARERMGCGVRRAAEVTFREEDIGFRIVRSFRI